MPLWQYGRKEAKMAVRLYARVSKTVEDSELPILSASKPFPLQVSDIVRRSSDPLLVPWEEKPSYPSVPYLQKYGTVEMNLGYGEDLGVEADDETTSAYTKFSARHRYRWEPTRSLHRGTLALQWAEAQTPTYRAEEVLYYRLPFQMDGRTQAGLGLQMVRGKMGALAQLRTEIKKYVHLTPDLTNILGLGYDYKYLSLDAPETGHENAVSEDIFSVYKRNHYRQLFFQNTLWYTPFLDLILYGKVRMRTNTDFNPARPDYYYGRFGLKKLWGGFESRIYYEARRWLADENRLFSRWENRLYTHLGYAWWWNHRRRMQLQFVGRYSFESKEAFLYAGLGMSISSDRLFRDFHSSEVDFEAEKSYLGAGQ